MNGHLNLHSGDAAISAGESVAGSVGVISTVLLFDVDWRLGRNDDDDDNDDDVVLECVAVASGCCCISLLPTYVRGIRDLSSSTVRSAGEVL